MGNNITQKLKHKESVSYISKEGISNTIFFNKVRHMFDKPSMYRRKIVLDFYKKV